MQQVLLTSKNIRELMNLEDSFYIPTYQRGYRWTSIQVKELLEDLYEFMLQKQSRDEIYWLQPVIVKKVKNQWELIDGQQRLTTIYLILKVFTTYMKRQNEPYKLRYQSREESADFLENITTKSDTDVDNIDYYYMLTAYQTIDAWIEEKLADDISEFAGILKANVKVIWYEIGEKTDPIELFSRTNSGKILLNDAELIKALFLSSTHLADSNSDEKYLQLKQLEISNQWDQIEYSLQNEKFWFFLQNNSKHQYSTRIKWLFELVVSLTNTIDGQWDQYHTFHVFNEIMEAEIAQGVSKETVIKNLWKRIFEVYQTLLEWYENRMFYHYVGYLLTTGVSLKILFQAFLKMNKDQFEHFLLDKIAGYFHNISLDKLDCTKNKKEIANTLLLFNIFTLQNNSESNQLFDFERYKTEEWDIEHIHALQSKLPNEKEAQNALLGEFEGLITDLTLQQRVKDFIAQKETTGFEDLLLTVESLFSDDNFNINGLSNLTLLDRQTNRSYKNAIFPIKRKEIILRDRSGTYIPPCTKNVFLKYYSNNIQNMNYWSKQDRDEYLKAIETELQSIL